MHAVLGNMYTCNMRSLRHDCFIVGIGCRRLEDRQVVRYEQTIRSSNLRSPRIYHIMRVVCYKYVPASVGEREMPLSTLGSCWTSRLTNDDRIFLGSLMQVINQVCRKDRGVLSRRRQDCPSVCCISLGSLEMDEFHAAIFPWPVATSLAQI